MGSCGSSEHACGSGLALGGSVLPGRPGRTARPATAQPRPRLLGTIRVLELLAAALQTPSRFTIQVGSECTLLLGQHPSRLGSLVHPANPSACRARVLLRDDAASEPRMHAVALQLAPVLRIRPGDRLQLACLAEAAEALRHVAGLTLRPDAGSYGRRPAAAAAAAAASQQPASGCATAAAATRQRRPTPVTPLAFPSSHLPPLTSSAPSSTAPASSSSLILVEAAIASGSGLAGLPLGEVLGSAAPQRGQKFPQARSNPCVRPTRRCKRTLACPGLASQPAASPPEFHRDAAACSVTHSRKSAEEDFSPRTPRLSPSLGAA